MDLSKVVKAVRGVNHRVIHRGESFPVGFFHNEVFKNEKGLEGIYFDKVLRIGRDHWFEMFGDRFFSVERIVMQICKEMRIGLSCRDFPMMRVECPNLVKLDLKLFSDQVSLDFLRNFKKLKELTISGGAYSILGFRYLKLESLEMMKLESHSLELGFYGCHFPKLKKLDIGNLREMMIILDTGFDVLGELDLSCTSLIFPISLEIPNLHRLNIQNHQISPGNNHVLKLKLHKLKNLERIDISTFDHLQMNSILLETLKEVHFNRDVSVNRKFEKEEIETLMSLRFAKLGKLVIQLREPGEYDIEGINLISSVALEVVFNIDGVKEQYKLNLGKGALNVKISTVFSPQRKKRRSV